MDNFLIIAAVHFGVMLSPGVSTIIIMRSAVSGGRKQAFGAAIGTNLGALVNIIFVLTGVSGLIAQHDMAIVLLRYLGAGYLVYLGASIVLNVVRRSGNDGLISVEGEEVPSSPRKSFVDAFLAATLNPKVLLFYLVFLGNFVLLGSNREMMGFYGLQLFFQSILYWNLFAILITVKSVKNTINHHKYSMDLISGVVLILFGIKLLLP